MYLNDTGDYMETDNGEVIFDFRKKTECSDHKLSVSNVDFIFHDIMHSKISMEDGIVKCKDGIEAGDLLRMLIACGELNETKYNAMMQSMLDRGLLDKFQK